MKVKNYSINLKNFILILILFVLALFSFIFWKVSDYGTRRVFIFESSDSKTLCIENRFVKGESSASKYQMYIDELLLGPISEHCKPVFSTETKVLSCFEREGTLFVDLSSDLVKVNASSGDFKDKIELFRKNILSNFTSLKKVEVFIQGNVPFEY